MVGTGRAAVVWAGIAFVMIGALADSHPVVAGATTINNRKDSTIFSEEEEIALANGSGTWFHAGNNAAGDTRRALLQFNIQGLMLPSDTVINTVSLQIHCDKSPPGGGTHTFSLHKLTGDFGEAGSVGQGKGEGQGGVAQTGDATWNQQSWTLSNMFPWMNPGGDFVETPSASVIIGECPDDAPVLVEFASAQMVADVQDWVDNPLTAFGWILRGDETSAATARRFQSKDDMSNVLRWPTLAIEFDPPGGGSPGAIPDGEFVSGQPMVLGKTESGMVSLDWEDSCREAPVYAVYEGDLSQLLMTGSYNHGFRECLALTTMYELVPNFDLAYYLVVPEALTAIGTAEGSYGRDSRGFQRPQANLACLSQLLGDPVCPGGP